MSDSSSLSISLRVPDQLAIKYALPGAVPADRINLDLMSLAFDRMSRLQRQSLLEGIRETVADFSAPAGEFPVRADTSSNNITLSASVDNLDKLYHTLQSNLIVRGLFSFITDTRNTKAVMAAGNIIPASYHRELLDTEPVVFSQLAVEHKGDQLVFDFKDLPDELIPVENIEGLLASVIPVDGDGGGARFRIPLLVPEGVPTGDGRIFKPLSVTTRDLPIPLLWQMKTGTGHDGSVLVGRIDHVERVSNGLGNAHGVF